MEDLNIELVRPPVAGSCGCAAPPVTGHLLSLAMVFLLLSFGRRCSSEAVRRTPDHHADQFACFSTSLTIGSIDCLLISILSPMGRHEPAETSNMSVAVADHGHFGRAAAACNVSQPTLSGQILKLEAELGLRLFEREGRGARVSDRAAAVVAQARATLAAAAGVTDAARAARDPFAGPLEARHHRDCRAVSAADRARRRDRGAAAYARSISSRT